MHIFVNYSSSNRRCFLMATWNSMFLSTSQGKEIHGVCLDVWLFKGTETLFFCLLKETFYGFYHGIHQNCSPPFGITFLELFPRVYQANLSWIFWAMDKKCTDLLRGYCWDESGWIDFCFHDGNWKFFEKYGNIWWYMHIIYMPGTQMTSIFEGQPPKTRPFPIKTRVIRVPGVYMFCGIEFVVFIASF